MDGLRKGRAEAEQQYRMRWKWISPTNKRNAVSATWSSQRDDLKEADASPFYGGPHLN